MIYLFDIQISWMFGINSITTVSGGDDWIEEFLEGFIGFFVTSDDITGLDHWVTLKNELDLGVKITKLGVNIFNGWKRNIGDKITWIVDTSFDAVSQSDTKLGFFVL